MPMTDRNISSVWRQKSLVVPFIQKPIPKRCDCGASSKYFFRDYSHNETVCRKCGLVLGNCPSPVIEKDVLLGKGMSHTNRGMFGKNLGTQFNAFVYSNKLRYCTDSKGQLFRATNYDRKRRLNLTRDLTRKSLEEPQVRKLLNKASKFVKKLGLGENDEFFDYVGYLLRKRKWYRAYNPTQITWHAIAIALKRFYPDKLNGEITFQNGKKRKRGRPKNSEKKGVLIHAKT